VKVVPGERERVLRNLRRRRIAVVGLGVSNRALLRFLLARGARSVAAGDVKTAPALGPVARELASMPIDLRLGPGYLDILKDAELVFLTPGMRKDLPEIAAARERGAEISSEMGLLLSLTRARTVGVTGSAGKTTTTSLVRDMLVRSGLRVVVGGNIGTPLIEQALDFGPETTMVLEMSSFQLQLVDRSPHVAAVLNIAPNHLDVHRDFDEYVGAKKLIYRYQRPEDWAVFSADDPVTRAMAREKGTGVALFGRSEPADVPGVGEVPYRAFVDGDRLAVRGPEGRGPETLCLVRDVRLRGEHNLLNILAAALLTLLAGGRLDAAGHVAVTFEGVEHRLEPVVTVGGVTLVNDSIATSPDRTAAALASFPGPLHLIAGGYDKKLPFDALADSVVGGGKVTKVVLLGQTAGKIRRALEEAAGEAEGRLPAIVETAGLEEAVRESLEGARPGTTVLFSPACASFDMFTNFEERGRAFKEIARRLAGKEAGAGDGEGPTPRPGS
jgi:UDP-N-acetylmuramoylalanine--D-glutamate ligase